MKIKQWDLVILLGALCLVGDAISTVITGSPERTLQLFLTVLGLVLIGAGASGKRRNSKNN